jgi:hypothetical protein
LPIQESVRIDKLDFDWPICKNTGPTHPAVIMIETIPRSMAETLAAIKALTDADQFRLGAME